MANDITHLGTVIVPVADQDGALDFYAGTLGFEVRVDGEYGPGERWLEVAPPGAATTLALVPAHAAPRGIELSFATRSAGRVHAHMLAHGVDADAELLRMGPEMPPMFTFRDPDGHTVRMVERD